MTKIILTIPSLINIVYMTTYWNVDFYKWISNKILEYQYQDFIIIGLILIQSGYLIYRLWNHKNVHRKTKTEWTWLLLIFNFISSLVFIWKIDAELIKTERT